MREGLGHMKGWQLRDLRVTAKNQAEVSKKLLFLHLFHLRKLLRLVLGEILELAEAYLFLNDWTNASKLLSRFLGIKPTLHCCCFWFLRLYFNYNIFPFPPSAPFHIPTPFLLQIHGFSHYYMYIHTKIYF